jgi:broad specificity phosphatase PhoE
VATRVTFLCAAATALSRVGAFPDRHAPLDDGGQRKAAALRLDRARCDRIVTSPDRAATETLAALGQAGEIDAAVADMDFGAWAGRSFDAIAADDSGPLAAWFADPAGAAPDGETLEAVRVRVGAWLDRLVDAPCAMLVVSHTAVLRGAIAHVLAVPVAATLAIDVAPLATLVVSHHGRWRMQELTAA